MNYTITSENVKNGLSELRVGHLVKASNLRRIFFEGVSTNSSHEFLRIQKLYKIQNEVKICKKKVG